MSEKNFASYGDMETLLTEIASKCSGTSKNFQGTIEEWNALTTEQKKTYDHASIPDSIDGGVTFPANKVVMTGGGNVEDAINDVASGLSTMIHSGNVSAGRNISIPGWVDGNVRMIIVKRASISVAAVVLTEYWTDTVVTVYGTLPAGITIAKSQLSNDIVITNGTGNAIAYLVIN